MLHNIASCQLAEVHHYFSTTGQYFNNHNNYVYLENYERDRYNCHNLFLKVQSDGELRKSPDEPFHILMAL